MGGISARFSAQPIYAAGVLYDGSAFVLDVPPHSPIIATDFSYVGVGKYNYEPSFFLSGIDWYSVTVTESFVAGVPFLADVQEPGGLPAPFISIFIRQGTTSPSYSDEEFFLVFSGS